MTVGLEICLYQGNNRFVKSSWQALELIGYLSEVVVLLSAMCMKLGGSNGYAKYYHCAEIIKR